MLQGTALFIDATHMLALLLCTDMLCHAVSYTEAHLADLRHFQLCTFQHKDDLML